MTFIDDAFRRVLEKINKEEQQDIDKLGIQTHDAEGSLRSLEDIVEYIENLEIKVGD